MGGGNFGTSFGAFLMSRGGVLYGSPACLTGGFFSGGGGGACWRTGTPGGGNFGWSISALGSVGGCLFAVGVLG